jgi:hypothetical protein
VLWKNKIKYEWIYSYTFNKKKIKDSSCIAFLEFDSLGNIIKRTEYVDNKKDSTKIKYEYNTDHSVHRKLINYTFPRTDLEIREYRYDSAGNKDIVYYYNVDTTYMNVEKNIYNEKNQLILYYSGSNENAHLREKRSYSEDGNMSVKEVYDRKGKLIGYYAFEYDKNANKKTVYSEDVKGKHWWEDFLFDSAARCIKHNSNLPEADIAMIGRFPPAMIGHLLTEEYTYAPDGMLIECVVFLDNNQKNVFRYYYQRD